MRIWPAMKGSSELDDLDELNSTLNLDPNNTNFPQAITREFSKIKGDDVLRNYQKMIKEYVVKNPHARGILIYHDMGRGKSRLASAIADELRSDYKVILMTAKALRANIVGSLQEYMKLIGRTDKEIKHILEDEFRYVTINASNLMDQLAKATATDTERAAESLGHIKDLDINLNNSVIIVDEAHNFFNSLANGNKTDLYDAIMNAKNAKIIFLTGTPVVNDPIELVACFNMLSGDMILPENYHEFYNYFVSEDKTKIKNAAKFKNRVAGYVSYYGSLYDPDSDLTVMPNKVVKRPDYPDEFPLEIIKSKMSDEQYGAYDIARDRERAQIASSAGRPPRVKGKLEKPKVSASSSYRVKSRAISNFWMPRGKTEVSMLDKNEVSKDGLKKHSPKMLDMLNNVEKHIGELQIVYSSFVSVEGIGVFARILEEAGWKEVMDDPSKTKEALKAAIEPEDTGEMTTEEPDDEDKASKNDKLNEEDLEEIVNKDIKDLIDDDDDEDQKPDDDNETIEGGATKKKGTKTFAIITGNVDFDHRVAVKNAFNDISNAHGENIGLLLISSSGAEGLDLKNVRHTHIMEPFWHWARIGQVKARAVRLNSHKDLPDKERNVHTYIYLSTYPESVKIRTEPTTDEDLFLKAVQNKQLINQFLKTLVEAAVDCNTHNNNKKVNCLMCYPDNKALYHSNYHKDIAEPNPCKALSEKKATVKSILVDDVEYYFDKDDNVFKYKEDADAYVALGKNTLEYQKVLMAIKSKSKK